MRTLFILLILVAFESHSQSYTVIHIIGKIYNTESGSYLTKGSKVSENSSLKFESDGARAAVLSSSRGRFVIQKNAAASSQSDALYALSSVISPVRGRLSTRAGAINNSLDFQKYFNEGTVALIGNEYEVKVSPEAYPISDSKFFYAQYQLGEETINKKLRGESGKLNINLTDFFSVDGNPIDASAIKEVKLYYYDTEEQKSAFITDMNISYIPEEELKSLVDQFPDDKEAMLEVINSLYGKCTEEQLSKAIEDL
ncbi:hypothetical protein [Ekhidna sp.]|uniref:hypothetical protein n=1 Tax=Ekhidna sp. TaxID=2608089 RepID=UPI003B5005F7